MKKILLSLVALLLVGASAFAKTLECDLSALPASSENTTWDAETNTFAWKAGSYNSTELFSAGDYSAYTTLNYTTEAGSADHFRIIFKFSNGTGQVTFNPAPVGEHSYTWAEMGVSEDNLPFISTIRISGANDVACSEAEPATITLNNVSLEGPDVVIYNPIKLYPQDWTDIRKVESEDTRWADVTFPFIFKDNGGFWGSHDNSATPNADVTGYESISIVVSATGGGSIRAFLWDDATNSRKIVFFYPEEKYDSVADWTASSNISSSGIYKASLCGCTKLLGVKWNWGANNIVVDAAYVTKASDKSLAVNEVRTLSSAKILDFTEVTDVEAYIATAKEGNTVVMEKVTGAVPANTGLVLKQVSDKAIISIPTCGEATENVEGNLLVATQAETTLDSEIVGAANYVLAGKGADMGWYYIADTPATLAAGKAYLSVPFVAPGANSRLNLSWNNATAIKSVAKTASNGTYYNLQGIKVAAPQKGGMYIVNGKKVIY